MPMAEVLISSDAAEVPGAPWTAQLLLERALDEHVPEAAPPDVPDSTGHNPAQTAYDFQGQQWACDQSTPKQQRPSPVGEPHLWLPHGAASAAPGPALTLPPRDTAVAAARRADATTLAAAPADGGRERRAWRQRQAAPLGPSVFGRSLPKVFMAACASQGMKAAMEDAHFLAALDPKEGVMHPRGSVTPSDQVSSIGVFDGHQGALTATFAARHMPELLHSALVGNVHSAIAQPSVGSTAGLSAAAVSSSFLSFDRWWCDARCDPSYTEHGWDESGATALVGLVAGNMLTVGNAGDGAAMMARGGRAARLSEEHRPSANAAEAERVLQAGGRLVALAPGAAARVVGASGPAKYKACMVTRALGDFAFKHPDPLLSPEPSVRSVLLTPSDVMLLVATDGVTDVLGDDDALAIALDALEKAKEMTDDGTALAQAAARAVTAASLAHGSRDNVTAAVMVFDWQDRDRKSVV